MGDEPSDDVSEWYGVEVWGGWVTMLQWFVDYGLLGTIPFEIGALSALGGLYLNFNKLSCSIPPMIGALTNLILLYLGNNELRGYIPPVIGALSNLTVLHLHCNPLSVVVPSALSNLINPDYLELHETALINAPNNILYKSAI